MHAIWYAILALMLTAYAVLDGFDLGAGALHTVVARTDDERRTVLAAIGPLWDGNEVWLIASAGVFVFAFPRAYAAAFSGLYLPLMIALWLLVLRGISIEFRSKLDHPLWRSAWDTIFAGSSAAMAIVFGVAIGNLVRGVPIDATGYFHEDLFGTAGPFHPGAIDGYSAVVGLFTLVALGAHGATFLAWKTSAALSARSASVARRLWAASVALLALATTLTAMDAPSFLRHVLTRPWLWPLPFCALAAAWLARIDLRAGRPLRAFLASCTFLVLLLVATAGALYPALLRSTLDEAYTLSAASAASDEAGLAIGLWIWLPAISIAVGYFVYLFRSFRGKAEQTGRHY